MDVFAMMKKIFSMFVINIGNIKDYITFKIPDKDNSIWDNIPEEIKVEDLKIFGDAKTIFKRWIEYGERRNF